MLTVYSKPNCPYCVRAKRFLEEKNIPFQELSILEHPELREFLIKNNHKTVPQIYLGENLFVEGGYEGLSQLTDEEIKNRLSSFTGE